MICITCANWSPKTGDPKLARLGFAPCRTLSPGKWVTFAARYERDCEHHRQAVFQLADQGLDTLAPGIQDNVGGIQVKGVALSIEFLESLQRIVDLQ